MIASIRHRWGHAVLLMFVTCGVAAEEKLAPVEAKIVADVRFDAKPPADWMALAREVYEFCPDIVDQGTETVERLAYEMRVTNELFLWWD